MFNKQGEGDVWRIVKCGKSEEVREWQKVHALTLELPSSSSDFVITVKHCRF